VPALDDVRQAVVSAGLTAGDGHEHVTSRTLTDAEVADVVHWAGQERLDGLAWRVLAGPESLWRLTERQRADLLDCHLGGLRATVAAEATAVWAVEVLDAVDVRSWLLKGLACGHLDYPDPAWRTSFDADLLVARGDLGRALDALLAAGCRRTTPPLRDWWERRFARAVELVSPDGVEVDLHAAVADGALGVTLDHDALRRDSVETVIGGRRCRVLSPAGRLVATSAALVFTRGPNLRLARDIAQMIEAGADVDSARQLAGRWAFVVDDALARSNDVIGRPAAEGLPQRAVPSHASTWSTDAIAAWRVLPWRQRPIYALGVIFPSRANLASRGLTRWGHVRRLGRSAAVFRDRQSPR
jgi:hypothetical protein